MELVSGGELYEYVERKGHLSDDAARRIFSQLLDGALLLV
jgi:serine/threonine protein kinase